MGRVCDKVAAIGEKLDQDSQAYCDACLGPEQILGRIRRHVNVRCGDVTQRISWDGRVSVLPDGELRAPPYSPTTST